jgi:DNA-binding LacI/PurR family transcriptional regulator
MTVSRAINNPSLVAEPTRRMILNACKEMEYIPNSAARALVKKETNMIGLLVPDIDYYYADIIKRITLFLESRNYSLLLCNYDEKRDSEIKYLEYLLQERVDGIIVFPFKMQIEDYIRYLNKIPMIFVNKPSDLIGNYNVSYVGTDNYQGSKILIEYILKKGYRRIGAVHSDLIHNTISDRMRGYKEALSEHGIAYDASIARQTNLLFADGYNCAAELINEGVDAIFAFNDVCALGVIKKCMEMGLAIPGDIGIAGYDNINYLDIFGHKLTTVDYNGPIAGEQAATVLLEEIENPELPKRTTILNPRLIIGETV